ncbi:outer membrane beta-barrel protein [Pararhodonellum marinum]|uniref:outer membrane beta-barrel protein n=1 Tax=Pararhodonellum marinum TaxID=2755358 RepID=UPI00188F6A1E|nr:outer membrane beta-barrel protein [Pararhodonellum marinum]
MKNFTKRFVQISIVFFLFFFFSIHLSYAQQGNNQLVVGADLGITTSEYFQSQYPTGFGLGLKGLIGVGQTGQVSITSGFHRFILESSNQISGFSSSYDLVPLMLGYRAYFNHFFVEPQIGASFNTDRTVIDGFKANESMTELSWALEAGYVLNRVEFSARFQNTGPVPFNMAFIGLRAAYRISL